MNKVLLNKIKWALGILLVFFLILATNLIDKDNFKKVRNSIVTIYEDRIVANDLIFELSLLIHEKEMAAALSDTSFFNGRNKQINGNVEALVEQYKMTKLTREEASIFDALQIDLDKLDQFETSANLDHQGYAALLSDIKDHLYKLSKIQLSEGKNQVSISNEAIEGIDLFTRMEIYILIFLAIILQVIVIYSPGKNQELS